MSKRITSQSGTGTPTRVVCAMSGGVDSAVAAALLVRQGYDVIGVTLQVWPAPDERERACCSLSAVEDARRVATRIGIPHYVMNMQDAFREAVIAPFIDAYRRGETPNPCIACNRRIKFGLLLDAAHELGAGYLATGHYARILQDADSGRWFLRRGVDEQKDQTYVLYGMTQAQLAQTLFPLGDYEKTVTRTIAEELDLRVAAKPDSQEICFVPDDNYRAFLRTEAPEIFRPGALVDAEGTTLGSHQGIADFTIGQRRGLGITTREPRYVVEIDPYTDRVVVGTNEALMRRTVAATDVVCGKYPAEAFATPRYVTAKIRSKMHAQPGSAQMLDGRLIVTFDAPLRAVTPGQALVCYEGDDVVAGGTILRGEAR